MLYHLVSTNPDEYGTIRFRSSINTMNSMVMYRISSLSTIASFSMTTPDDYLIIETTINDEPYELIIHFQDHGFYDLRTLAYELDNLVEGQLVPVNESPPITITISMDSTNRLVMTANKEFAIKEASYNVKLLLGLYHSTLPINSSAKTMVMPSISYVSYGNVLYLTARTDFVSVVNMEDKEISKSIAYKVNELLYPSYPIQSKLPGQWSIIHSDQLSSLEFQLCDFQMHPVKLHSPLYITIEVEPLSNSGFLPDIKQPIELEHI